ncbi:mobile element protein [Actinacidiphila epipremni]|uniref:mobile element protein n=1 Tax=Actinacidiphila epipremni TaxID=2053013 RepID=UPI002AFE7304|nr:mobile element protein [Actinacidiphila epipremni]
MALPPEPYLADPADLAVWLPVPADDPKLLAALAAASKRFAGAVRHPVRAVLGDTTTLYGDCTDRLLLPAAPVLRIVSVTVDGTALEAGTSYKVRRDASVLRRIGDVWPDWAEVDVVWDHGYDPIPDDVQEVVIDQARSLFRVQPGVQTIQAGGEAITYGAQAAVGVTAQWTTAVERYRLNRGESP